MAITLETTHTLLTHSHIRTLYSSENELKLYIKHYDWTFQIEYWAKDRNKPHCYLRASGRKPQALTSMQCSSLPKHLRNHY